jgi:hypothetical protein
VKNKGFAALIAIIVIAGMLVTGIGIAFAEPYHVLSGRDKVGTYGKDGKSARAGFINEIMFEGSTSDTSETKLYALDPSSDNVIALPDNSGTVSLTTDAFAGALADTKIYVGNSAGTAVAQTHALVNDITGTMDNSGTINTTIVDNAVGTAEANINTVTLTIANTTSTNSVTVDSTHTLLSYYVTTLGGINGTNLINDPFYNGTGTWTVSMANALQGGDAVYTFNFLRTN